MSFPNRLDVPELRAMVSHWPWHRVAVCPACEPAFLEEFRRRVLLLAPEVMAQEGDVTEKVCLLCGNQDERATYFASARWVDAAGSPVAGRFHVCQPCRGKLLVNNIVSAAELGTAEDFEKLLGQLPEVSDDLVRRSEGWSPAAGEGPAGSCEVQRGLSLATAGRKAAAFWAATAAAVSAAGGPPVRGAMLLPEKSGAIRTHLELRWQTRDAASPVVVALDIYRGVEDHTLVHYGPRPAR